VTLTRGRWSLAPRPAADVVLRWVVLRDGAAHSHKGWIAALRNEADARRALTDVLRSVPFDAYLWETPAVSPGDDGGDAEMALTERAALARSPAGPSAFAAAFRVADRPIATFANLGGDAMLVSPHPAQAPGSAHLASFVRGAPDGVVDALWIAVSNAVSEWLATRRYPVWVSTSGLAVPWLHVRLDRVPKYYAYRAYTPPDHGHARPTH